MLLDKTEEQKITAQNVRWFLGVLLMKSGENSWYHDFEKI